MKPIVERFFRYVGIDTQSTWEAETVPASSNEFVLGQMLVDELKALGIENAWMINPMYLPKFLPTRITRFRRLLFSLIWIRRLTKAEPM